MKMQDKEFDKLFSTKLDSYEVEPSRAVWQGISEELGGNKRRKMIPFLSIAASIIVLAAADVLFIPRNGKVVKPVKHELVKNHPSKLIPATTTKPQVIDMPKTTLVAADTKTGAPHIAKYKTVLTTHRQNIPAAQQIPVKAPEQTVLAAVSSSTNNVTQPSVIDTGKIIAAAPIRHQQTEKAVTPASALADKEKRADNPPVKKHRVRSFGDVLNVMIAAVDKRKDKIVEFSNTDGDESSITGINLGIIKIKKEN